MEKFVMGVDISSLQAMEDQQAKFYDLDGKEKDALSILAKHGVNYIRLRLFYRPTESFDGGNYCDLEHTLAMAKRVKKRGFGLLLDFHYSDFWADWRNQKIPHDWEGQSAKELESSVYRYTKRVIQEFQKQDAIPDMVQIGNEIGNGLLWNYGLVEHPKQMAAFLNAGLRAVGECNRCSLKIKTVLHVECGADPDKTEKVFHLLMQEGLQEYDYIGLSYYPYWSGSYGKLKQNMKNIETCFHKDIIIVETAFPYTDESHDDMPNVVTSDLTKKTMNLLPSVHNQRAVTEQIIQIVKESENGVGVFYWEPGWYQIPGVGVSRGKGNEWENQAMFDSTGHALESICSFESVQEKM
jgi:arabinogalactan endo-1,4-beta-galactosidase